MAEVKKKQRTSEKGEKKRKKEKDGSTKNKKPIAASTSFSLLADEKAIDPTLSSLFAAKVGH